MLREGSIQEILRDAGVWFGQTERSLKVTCPRCRKKDKLYFYKTKPFFACMKCSTFRGRCEFALHEITGSSIDTLRQKLYGVQYDQPAVLNFELKGMWDAEEESELPSIADIEEVVPPFDFYPLDNPAAAKGAAYLESRGIPKEVAMQYDIRYQPSSQRVFFPVKHQNKWVGWQGRLVVSTDFVDPETGVMAQRIKAVTSTGLRRSEVLMFSERLTGDSVVLCEGPVDALKAHLCGGNVATMGKKVSDGQLDILRFCGIKKLYLALDPDAYRESQDVVRKMSGEMEVYDMRPPRGKKDLGEMSMEEVLALQKSAIRVTPSYLFVHLEDGYVRRKI